MTRPDVGSVQSIPRHRGSRLDRWLRGRAFEQLEALPRPIAIRDPLGEQTLGGDGGAAAVHIDVHDLSFYRLLASGGSVGAGEAYFLGYWDCNDLVGLIRLFARHLDAADSLERGTARIRRMLRQGWHAWNRNSVRGSRRNIARHYDLGNELFETFLDPLMQYSCAVFSDPALGPETDLAAAQRAKLERIGEKLALTPEDHLLEIGTGWGGLAVYLADRFGCRVTTTTISGEQFRAATERVERHGLDDRVTLLQQDYRALEGRYDKLVSVEMIEAVGHQYLATYFDTCARLLKPDGRFLLQAITIADHRYEAALEEVDYIKRYIFPGGFLPSVSVLAKHAGRAGFRLSAMEDLGLDYAETLKHWQQRFDAAAEDLDVLGYDERFRRMWTFYFAYCRGAFLERAISDVQMTLERPAARHEGWLKPVGVT